MPDVEREGLAVCGRLPGVETAAELTEVRREREECVAGRRRRQELATPG